MNLFRRFIRFLLGSNSRSASPGQAAATHPARPPSSPSPPSPSVIPSTAEASVPEPSSPPLTQAASAPEATSDPYFAQPPPKEQEKEIKRPGGSLGLDAGSYLPIQDADLKVAAKGLDRFGNPWFGRRDLIPPTSDLRTNLIDRGMVSRGFLTPEQLREIHEVGDQMERLRPSLNTVEHHAALEGDAAVEADRQERARLKARKKQEAAERKQARIDAVAARKANDIVFLGRGVSAGLNDRQSQVERLLESGLPQLGTPAELAEALGLTVSKLRWLAFHTDVATRTHYVQFTVPKKSGGERILSAPHKSLAEAQRWIYHEIVARLPVEPAAQGFVVGRSVLSNAQAHCQRALVVNLDLEAFFPSIGFPRVRRVFQRVGYSPAVSTILALLTTESPRKTVIHEGAAYHVATGPLGLPQGACTSPGLSNQVAIRLDRRLTGLAHKLELSYTRYADDLTFSGDTTLEGRVGYLMARVRHIAEEEGFAVNESKTRVLRRHTAQKVTGLVVNDRPGVPRAEVRRLRAILHRARTEGLASQNREGRPDFLAWLQGKIAYVAMARPEVGSALKSELDALLRRSQ